MTTTRTKAEFNALMSQTTEASVALANAMMEQFDQPFDAVLILVSTTAMMAKSIGMSEKDVLEGVSAAFGAFVVKGPGDVAH